MDVTPPSTTNTAPVVNEDASEARNAAVLATSKGIATLFQNVVLRFGAGALIPIRDNNLGVLISEMDRTCSSDPRTCSRYNRDLSVKLPHILFPALSISYIEPSPRR
jgi:hypothetical protein